MQNTIPWQKIKSLEEEIKTLKSLGKKSSKNKVSKIANTSSIEGILKGVHASWKDFEEVKKMWFDEDHLLHQKHKK